MRTLYEIREYKTSTSYSTPMGRKLRPRWRAIKLIGRLTWKSGRDIVMVPVCVNI